MTHSKMIIAIDGYSSCGKSTVAKALARKLRLNYIDSGAMYRAVTLYFLRNDIPIPLPGRPQYSDAEYAMVLHAVDIKFKINPETNLTELYLNGKNVEHEIRGMAVSENVSHVSTLIPVRRKLVVLQQTMRGYGGLVMDGRDIGTAVFPDADLKIFMTADPRVRAKRRYDELTAKGIRVSFEEVMRNIESRDFEDSHRTESPLRKASDAIVLDNTLLDEQEQVDFVLKQVKEKIKDKEVEKKK